MLTGLQTHRSADLQTGWPWELLTDLQTNWLTYRPADWLTDLLSAQQIIHHLIVETKNQLHLVWYPAESGRLRLSVGTSGLWHWKNYSEPTLDQIRLIIGRFGYVYFLHVNHHMSALSQTSRHAKLKPLLGRDIFTYLDYLFGVGGVKPDTSTLWAGLRYPPCADSCWFKWVPAQLEHTDCFLGPSTVQIDGLSCRLRLRGSTTQVLLWAGNNHRLFISFFIEFYKPYTGITSFFFYQSTLPWRRNGTRRPCCCFSVQPRHETFCILYHL